MAGLTDQLAALVAMSPAQLRAEWRRVHRTPPPALSADLLLRGIAWRLQERQYGGLPAQTVRDLTRIATGPIGGGAAPRPEISLRAGTRLVRSWRGATYAVSVLEDGFLFDERRYSSLSSIAREITGAAWSGPRFFGLRRACGACHG